MSQKGSILIISLVLLSAFLVIMIAWSRFASLQAHVIADQGVEERAFQASEAGIEYVLFLLNSGVLAPDTLTYFIQEIVGVSDSVFELTFSDQTASSVTALSRGYDVNKLDRCQEIMVNIKIYSGSISSSEYYVDSWTHKTDTLCAAVIPSLLPPLPAPSPMPS